MKDAAAGDRIRELRLTFVKSLCDQRQFLQSLGDAPFAVLRDAALREQALRISHSLAGRGGTFGFQQLSEAADRLFLVLDSGVPDGPQLQCAARALIAEIDAGLAGAG